MSIVLQGIDEGIDASTASNTVSEKGIIITLLPS
jgi:hypothetical protein